MNEQQARLTALSIAQWYCERERISCDQEVLIAYAAQIARFILDGAEALKK